MEIKQLQSCSRLLGTFLVLSFSLAALASADSTTLEASMTARSSRRALISTPADVVQQFLMPHNRERTKLGLPPLQWSEKLASYASWWANQRKGDCALIHSNTNYGENIFWGSGKDWKPADAVDEWAAEKQYYDYKMNTCVQHQDCLHYTQIIWRQSLYVGCARVTCASGDTFITCNYDPHGNVIGQKPF
ncbi:PREDICTED: pathogenesis-related protein PRB1-3-like [Nelumbo nucifera]|uniref:Pathogenesis-related protein PRB1-3-like n=1 Tax=Nelumbo nucifera TaxID=4432 RepID=A0A1U8A5J8_NELNU|nr:PREDICTED: pathogenesis-related protein PRB1-3-like [Nelumbo nucifera]